jgi:hypothetical protein
MDRETNNTTNIALLIIYTTVGHITLAKNASLLPQLQTLAKLSRVTRIYSHIQFGCSLDQTHSGLLLIYY